MDSPGSRYHLPIHRRAHLVLDLLFSLLVSKPPDYIYSAI